MGKRKLKSFICMLLCICMLIPQSGLVWGAQSGNRLKPDTEDLEIHVGEVFGSGGGVSSKDRSNLKLDEVWKDVTGKGVNVAVIDGGANLKGFTMQKPAPRSAVIFPQTAMAQAVQKFWWGWRLKSISILSRREKTDIFTATRWKRDWPMPSQKSAVSSA